MVTTLFILSIIIILLYTVYKIFFLGILFVLKIDYMTIFVTLISFILTVYFVPKDLIITCESIRCTISSILIYFIVNIIVLKLIMRSIVDGLLNLNKKN